MDNLIWKKGLKTLDPLNEYGNSKTVDAYYLVYDRVGDFEIDTSFIEDNGFFKSERYRVSFQSMDECKSYIIKKLRKEIRKKIKEYTELLEDLEYD